MTWVLATAVFVLALAERVPALRFRASPLLRPRVTPTASGS